MIHRHALAGLALVFALTALPACASRKKAATAPAESASAAASAGSTTDKGYYEEEYRDGRYYVFGQEGTHAKWVEAGHMPYTRTQVGGGPYGTTVVYEIDQDWPALTDWLEQKFAYEHWSPEPPYFAVQEHDGRAYVFGNRKTHEEFMSTHHMPYARTQIGGGPGGVTVAFEIDQDEPAMTDWLEREYASRGASSSSSASPGASSAYYAETRKDGRYYVFGAAETEAAFARNGHMPYSRNLIGAGPGGATVVVEVDKDDDGLADRLQMEFDRRHGLKR